jgi:hypothetical protein
MELTEVKNLTTLTDKHDNYITSAIPLYLELAEAKTNNTFTQGSEPAGVKLFIAQAIEFNVKKIGLKSFTMGEVSYTYETELPKTVTDNLKPYKRVSFK